MIGSINPIPIFQMFKSYKPAPPSVRRGGAISLRRSRWSRPSQWPRSWRRRSPVPGWTEPVDEL